MESVREPDRIISYFSHEKILLAGVSLAGVIYNVGLLAGPVFQGKLIDAVARRQSVRQVVSLSLLFIFVIAIVQTARAAKRFYVRRFANNISFAMRSVLYESITGKSTAALNHENMGSLMTKAVSDVDACVEGMRKFTTEVFDTGVFLASYFIMLLSYDWKITLFSTLFIPLALFIAGRLRHVITKCNELWRKSMDHVADVTYDYVGNAVMYRLFGRESDNYESYRRLGAEYEKKAVAAAVWENAMMPLYRIIALCGLIVVVIAGTSNVLQGTWSIGVFSTYIFLFTALAEKASHAGKLFNAVQKAQVSWSRIKPFMTAWKNSCSVRFSECSVPRDSDKNTFHQVLVMRNTGFTVPGSDRKIQTVNLELEPGQIAGITGPVASGKSSLGRLFLGGMNYEGMLTVCGRELSSIPPSELCQYISYMGHDACLMSDTIYENVTLGDSGDAAAMLHAVCFDKDFTGMENGLQTLVGNGGIRLSGGQQERIALARALYHKRDLLVLDDPFSAVDKRTESLIMQNIKELCADSSVLLISHRLSLFPSFDKIVFIDQSGKVFVGTHPELMDSSSSYRALVNLQSGAAKKND